MTNANLNLGITNPVIAGGAPSIIFTGTVFDQTGATQPSGRTDVTGHITDSLPLDPRPPSSSRSVASSATPTSTSSTSRAPAAPSPSTAARGPWSGNTATDKANCAAANVAQTTATGACNTNILALADFLNGAPTNSSGARLLQGNAQRVWTLKHRSTRWVQDDFQAAKKLTVNYGIRYTVPGVIHPRRQRHLSASTPTTADPARPASGPAYYPGLLHR